MSYKEIYETLRQRLSDEEIAESYVFPEDLSEEEEEKVLKEFKKLRFERLRQRTAEDILLSELMQLRILMQEYLKKEPYIEAKSFGKYLEDYIRILKKTKRAFAKDIGLHYTRLSRVINNREEPNVELAYRLEKHSAGIIPALLWWKLSIKKQEYLIQQDHKTREAEGEKVKNALKFRA